MTVASPPRPQSEAAALTACIFDVDGVLIASPHEQAWREALTGIADPAHFTTSLYQAEVAGKPRADGALAALRALVVPDAARLARRYAERKQARLEALAHGVAAFPDALRLIETLRRLGLALAIASASRNATAMLRPLRLPSGTGLLETMAVNVCGRDVPHGKPAPDLFLLAAAELGIAPKHCLVVEDAPSGIRAARAGGMAALGIARLDDADLLRIAGADLVLHSLDDLDPAALARGHLAHRPVTDAT